MKNRTWQTLIKVIDINHSMGTIHFAVPGWIQPNEQSSVWISMNEFPIELNHYLSKGNRFFADANLGALKATDLQLSNFSFRG